MRMEKVYLILALAFITILSTLFLPNINEVFADEDKNLKINITAESIFDENIKNLSNGRGASILLNNQDLFPEEYNLSSINSLKDNFDKTTWQPLINGSNVSLIIDLKDNYYISNICLYKVNGDSTIKISYGTPFSYIDLITKDLSGYNYFINFDTNITTRYLRIFSTVNQSSIAEVCLYGHFVTNSNNDSFDFLLKDNNPSFNLTLKDQIGVNAFVDDPINIIKCAGLVREYHNIDWTNSGYGKNEFNNVCSAWNFDEYYKNLYDNNINICPCLQGSQTYLTGSTNRNDKPIESGSNSTDPLSYKEHASVLFQYAARYGSKKVDENKLLLNENNDKLSGLNYIKFYENSNEPDKTWEGDNAYFSPYDLCAMCSADYDGNEGKLGDTFGIKNADSNSKLVLGGLCNGSNATNYLNLMKFWVEFNRSDKKLPFDVINFHTYCGTSSPEDSNLKSFLQNVSSWRNIYCRDKEVWLSEFGWDTNINSPNSSKNETNQRNFLVRSYLISFSAGIQRSMMYMLRDASYSENMGKFSTSGLTTEKGAWNKKSSWYGIYAMKNALSDYSFDSVIREDDIYIYKFKCGDKVCYAFWSPTSNDKKISNFSFDVKNFTRPSLLELREDDYNGCRTRLKIENEKVNFNTSECPCFLFLSNKDENYIEPNSNIINIDQQSIKVEFDESNIKKDELQNKKDSALLISKSLFDEQDKVPTFAKQNFSGKDTFVSGWKDIIVPINIIVDLKEEYFIQNVSCYDTYSTGKIEIYGMNEDEFETIPFYSYDLSTYNYWQVKDTNVWTRYIKIVKYDNAKVDELAFYGYSKSNYIFNINETLENNKQVNLWLVLPILVLIIFIINLILFVIFKRKKHKKL
jgi:hypothetical protein